MPATKAHVSKLVTRLCALPAQEKDEFGVKPQDIRDELGGALIRFALSDEDATRIVDWLIFERPVEHRRYRPGPGDIAEVARIVHEQQVTKLPEGCDKCDQTGWRGVKRTAKDPITRSPCEYDCRELCDCPLGKHLKLRESERKQLDQQQGVA